MVPGCARVAFTRSFLVGCTLARITGRQRALGMCAISLMGVHRHRAWRYCARGRVTQGARSPQGRDVCRGVGRAVEPWGVGHPGSLSCGGVVRGRLCDSVV